MAGDGPGDPGVIHVAFTEQVLEYELRTHVPAAPAGAPAGICARLVTSNSIFWECACGARGRVGRTADGMPYLDDEILRHTPGEDKLEPKEGA